MNKTLSQFAKKELKKNLGKCSTNEINLFKRMYGNLESPINEVVDNIPDEKLDWAMQQVENTINKK